VTPGEDWVEVPLADHPELREEGGWIALSDPDHFLEVIVGRSTGGCWFTAWRICTHGACEVAYEPDEHELVCPCHGSRFAETGEVLDGPAPRALTTFPTGISGDSIWIYRPL
jgi:Rieske Fe-S protein